MRIGRSVCGIAEMAAAEKINTSYVGRVLRLTPLAPEIVQAILEGRQPAGGVRPVVDAIGIGLQGP